ncbi:acyl carrier protein [Actinoplanes sp. GCM10030250]|uniref:acyl carrier protein n=1 Tax=Actinoplanes sp. GCM10030250 TaxID=3273376 RepID=UPI00360BEB40
MFDVLKRILVDDLQIRAEDITPAVKRTEVGIDSLAVTELATVLNSRLGIEIHDYELLELRTVGDIADLMDERCSAARERERAELQPANVAPKTTWSAHANATPTHRP